MTLRASILLLLTAVPASSQDVRYGNPVTPEHRVMYERACGFLVGAQAKDGGFDNDVGVTGICVMALLASGEDPNFGPYAPSIRAGVRFIVKGQDAKSGLLRGQMYQHGFGMLALAECYGALDERLFAQDAGELPREIGEALELSVRAALTSQKNNPWHAWRYDPAGKDADTSVSGAVLMGLLAARNAGIAVPDDALDKALGYFQRMTTKSGGVGYSGAPSDGASEARSSIAALVFAVAKRGDLDEAKATARFVRTMADSPNMWVEYCAYYRSQALFQTDYERWMAWSRDNTRRLIAGQADDGSLSIGESISHGPGGAAYRTGMLLLSSALDFTLLPVYER